MAARRYRTLTEWIVDRFTVDDKGAVVHDRSFPDVSLFASKPP